jgi:branched-chain amino acid transport system ATP-binding protein
MSAAGPSQGAKAPLGGSAAHEVASVGAPVLAVRNLETWYGPVNAIKGVNLEVQAGHIVAVLGANGAGKTTLLNTIAGVIDPFKGSVEFRGQPIHGQDPDRVARSGVVLVPEGRQVFPFLSVRENLLMGTFARASRDELEADMARIFNWFPRLLERQDQHGGLLSGGEQQMLAIGRALMARPTVLLLDEPSLGLSPLLTREIFSIVKRINDELKTSILVVEQNAAIALATADDGYIMELGRVVAAGTCAELMAKDDVKEFYLGGGHQAERGDGQKQRWKRRKTWR